MSILPERAPVRLCCPECGSFDIVKDATAAWDEAEQVWSLSGVQDAMTCQDCWNEFNEAEEVPLLPEPADAPLLPGVVSERAEDDHNARRCS